MSLLDSIFLDPAPFDIWLASSTTGGKGSGTQSDPYAGSVRVAPAIPISLTNPGADPREAIATVANNFAEGDAVTITGAADNAWNGTFPIYSVTSGPTGSFKYYMQAVPQSSPGTNAKAARLTFLFDEVMKTIPLNTTVHLGPGVFQTRGHGEGYAGPGWVPKAGQKIYGSGMEVTTLKLMYVSKTDIPFHAINGGDYPTPPITEPTYPNGFEAADFTVDCNLGGQLVLAGQQKGKDFAKVSCAAIKINGRDVRIRRIRAINYGTQVISPNPVECFVIAAGGAHPDLEQRVPPQLVADSVIEDCIIEKPAFNSVYTASYILINGNERPSTGEMAYHRGCVVRNCFINGKFQDNPVQIVSISAGAPATVTTRVPHGRVNGDWVVISGAEVNGSLKNAYNGSYQITFVDATTFQYTMVDWAGTGLPTTSPVGDIWVGRWSSNWVAVQDQGITQVSGLQYKIKTVTPHFKRPGNNVVLFNVYISTPPVGLANAFNNAFTVDEIVSPNELKITLQTTPEGSIDWAQTYAFIGTVQQGITADGGTGTVVEGNLVSNCMTGFYHDTFSTKDLVIRNNHFYRVNTGIYQALSGFSIDYTKVPPAPFDGKQSNSSQRNPTKGGAGDTIATFRTLNPHGFAVGQGVQVAGVLVSGTATNPFNGYFVVVSTSSTDPNLFTYLMTSAPSGDGDSGVTPTFSGKWQVRRLVIENNVIELGLTIHFSGWGYPSGITLSGGNFAPVYTFPKVLIRGNIIRQADNAVDTILPPNGLGLTSCGSVIVEDNVIDLNPPYNSFDVDKSSAIVKAFDNKTAAGAPIRGYNTGTKAYTEELATIIEDTLCISI